MLTIGVLGPLELRHDGERVPVPGGKTAELLIRLALDAGTTVRTERLIDDLWGDDADVTEKNTFHTKVSRLRRAIGDPAAVTGGRSGYALAVDPRAVDALEMLTLADHAAELLAAGDADGAVETATRALSLFRGEILPDAGDGDWLIPHRARLEAARLNLIETQLAARIELGAAGEVVAELEALVLRHPLREGLWARLITALYRDQRQADALAAYQRVRALLADQLGLDPGPELRALEQQVLVHADDLGEHPRRTDAGAASSTGNLPALVSELVGREDDVAELLQLVRDHRLVSLVGPAGVGKTRLAIEIARQREVTDGAWLVRLESAATADDLAPAIGDAFEMSGATERLIVDRLRNADALVVLDNCEQVLEPVGELVATVLDRSPRLRILVTSQAPLGLGGEHVYALEPLPIADSIALFTQRASERRRSFSLDADSSAAIEEVCRALDGLPLAIELAAARTRALSVQEIARRLDDRFNLLSDPSSRRPQRHRALRTAISWSYELLFPDEQRGLWALACFAGGAPLAGAEYVAAALGVPAQSAVDVIERLAERSLVAVSIGARGAVRYRLLDSVRAFALARLTEAQADPIAFGAHATWFETTAAAARAEEHGPRLAAHVGIFREERPNIDAAITWAADHDPLLGLRIALGFGWISVILGEGAVAANRLRRALHAAGHRVTTADRALALSMIGWDEAAADVSRARVEAQQSVELADLSGDPELIAAARFSLGFVLLQQGLPVEARQTIDEWRSVAGDVEGTWSLATGNAIVAIASLMLGDVARIHAACDEASPAVAAAGDGWLTSQFEANLGQLAQAEQRYRDSVAHFEQAVAQADRVGLPATMAFHQSSLGRAQQLAGDVDAAIASFERAIEVTRAVGPMRIVAFSRVRLGRALIGVARPADARAALAAADEWFAASGGGSEALLARCLLAVLDLDEHGPDGLGRLSAVLDEARAAGDVESQIMALDAQAAASVRAGDIDRAQATLETADALMPLAAHLVAETDRHHGRAARAAILATMTLSG